MPYLPAEYSELEDALLAANGATFIGIDTCTTPKLTGGKGNPPRDRVRKVTEGSNVMIFQNVNGSGYDKMVRRRLGKEGKNPDGFTLSPRAWGTRIAGTPFVEHGGQYYLEVIYLHSGATHYTLDGVRTPTTTIQGLPKKPDEAKQGGLTDKVIIRTFKLDSITRVTINRQTFEF